MSRSFLNVPNKPYIGAPFNAPIAFCEPSKMPPLTVPFSIAWLTYGAGSALPNVSVEVNMSQQGQTVVIDKIRSVYIDNLGNNVPVYVYFPSTNYTVPCQPNSAGWFNVLTNDLRAFVIGQGFTDADNGAQTIVAFSNIQPPPYTNIELNQSVALWRASPAIQRGNTIYNSRFAPPALGDQTRQAFVNIAPAGNLTDTILPAQANGFYVVTNIFVTATQLTSSLPIQLGELFFESTGPSGVLYRVYYTGTSGTNLLGTLLNIQPAQIKLNANEMWRLRANTTMVGGIIELVVNFTYLPE